MKAASKIWPLIGVIISIVFLLNLTFELVEFQITFNLQEI